MRIPAILPVLCVTAGVAQAQSPELVDRFLAQGGWSVEYGGDLSALQGDLLKNVEDRARMCSGMAGARQTACYAQVGGAIEGYLGSALDALARDNAAARGSLDNAALGEAYAKALSGDAPLVLMGQQIEIGISPVTLTETVEVSRPTVSLGDCSTAIYKMECPQIRVEDSKQVISREQALRPYIRLREDAN